MPFFKSPRTIPDKICFGARPSSGRTTITVRVSRVLLVALLAVSGSLFLFSNSALADDEREVKAASLPPGIPPIPGPKDRETALLLTQKNEPIFEDILIAPLASWLKDGKFAMRVVRSLDFPWKLDAGWEDSSKRNLLEYRLKDDFSLEYAGEGTPGAGLPFGTADDINEESDPVKKAYKILWNIAYAEAAPRDLYYQIELSWVGTQSLLRSATGALYRKFFFAPPAPKLSAPKAEAKDPNPAATTAAEVGEKKPSQEKAETSPAITFGAPGDVFFETALRIFAPAVVAGFTEFSFRFRGSDEDQLWLYSPVLKLIRPLLDSNRSDPVLGGNLTFDDFFVTSSKIHSVRAKVVDQKVILVPVPALTFYRTEAQTFAPQAVTTDAGAKPASGDLPPAKSQEPKADSAVTVKGFQKKLDGSTTMVLWNYQSRQLPQLSPWVPTSISFVPHRVWIIEVFPTDPFYAYGREILIVDQEMMLPVYKLVYDRIGEYRKTVLGGWGLARSKDGKTAFPFSAFVMAVDQSSQTVTAITTQQIQSFQGKDARSAETVTNWFDPQKYPGGKPEEKPAEDKKKPAEEQAQGFTND
ncbi:MAG: DUF1329 domain-containing protein [Bdellovibrionota bacterium]